MIVVVFDGKIIIFTVIAVLRTDFVLVVLFVILVHVVVVVVVSVVLGILIIFVSANVALVVITAFVVVIIVVLLLLLFFFYFFNFTLYFPCLSLGTATLDVLPHVFCLRKPCISMIMASIQLSASSSDIAILNEGYLHHMS